MGQRGRLHLRLIMDLEKRYQAWSEVMFKAFLEDDVGLGESIWADDYTWTAINAFGEHEIRKGRE